MNDLISREEAVRYIASQQEKSDMPDEWNGGVCWAIERLSEVKSETPSRDVQKRVLWTGWKGYRDTRYKCPRCKKPVRNDDVYCHKCGQKLMFPRVSFTPYIEGQEQKTIVRWDDEK